MRALSPGQPLLVLLRGKHAVEESAQRSKLDPELDVPLRCVSSQELAEDHADVVRMEVAGHGLVDSGGEGDDDMGASLPAVRVAQARRLEARAPCSG